MIGRCIRIGAGVVLVIARGGSALFSVSNFLEYWDIPAINSKSTLGVITATVGLVSTVVTITYTRFWNIVRKASAKKKLSDQRPLDENLLEAQPERHASWCRPGVETNALNSTTYLFFQFTHALYGLGSGSAGILSAYSLMKFFQNVTHFEYASTCDHEENIEKVAALNVAMIMLFYANYLSFSFYNLAALRDYFEKLVIEKGYRDIKWYDYLTLMGSSLLGSLGVWFATVKLLEIVQDNTLCPIFNFNFSMPGWMIKMISGINASGNFCTVSLLGAGSMHHTEISAQQAGKKENPSELGCMELPLKLSIWGNCFFNAGWGTFISLVMLPKTMFDQEELTKHPAVIASAIPFAFCAMYLQYILDTESTLREKKARRKEREGARNTICDFVEKGKYDPTLFSSTKNIIPISPCTTANLASLLRGPQR